MPENMFGIKSILTASTMTIGEFLTCILCSVLLGFLISLIYIFTHRKSGYSQSYVLTMTMLPAIIAVIILVIGDSVSSALSLAGAFTLVRFRSAPGDPKDIGFIFFDIAAGLACGVGLYGYGAIFVLILCAVIFAMERFKLFEKKEVEKTLKITIPEDLNYEGAFDDVLDEYTRKHSLTKIKTTDLGALFELCYSVTMKPNQNEQEFLNELRCRNGNLNIILSAAPQIIK